MTSASTIGPEPRHARRMDRMYRYQRHVYDFTRKYYLFGRDSLIDGLDVPPGGRVLEIGCGTGRNLAAAARRNSQAMFYGVDISEQMLISAQASARRAGLAHRIRTAAGDAECFDACAAFDLPGYDRVFFSYSLSMVPGWRRALETAIAQIAPEGSLHIVDFGQMEKWPTLARGAMRHWLARFHVTPRADLIAEAERLGERHGLRVETARIAGGYAWLIVLIRPRPSHGLHANQL